MCGIKPLGSISHGVNKLNANAHVSFNKACVNPAAHAHTRIGRHEPCASVGMCGGVKEALVLIFFCCCSFV